MSTKETVVIEQVEEKLKRLNQLAENLHSGKGLSAKKINKLLLATNELQESLAVYKFLRALPKDQNLDLELNNVDEEEAEPVQIVEEPVSVNSIIKQEVEEFEEAIAEEAEIVEEPQVEEVVSEGEISTPVEEESVEEPIIETQPEVEPEPEVQSMEETISEEAPVEEQEQEIEEPVEEEEEVVEHVVEEPIVATNSIEEFNNEINEEMSSLGVDSSGLEVNEIAAMEEDKSINTRIQRQPIGDLRRAIGLNERFLYANELFNGNMEAFNLALNELNHIESVEDAFRIIDLQLKPKYNWVAENEAVTKFIDLVERRFL